MPLIVFMSSKGAGHCVMVYLPTHYNEWTCTHSIEIIVGHLPGIGRETPFIPMEGTIAREQRNLHFIINLDLNTSNPLKQCFSLC